MAEVALTTTTVPTFTANIYVGLHDRAADAPVPSSDAINEIQQYVDAVGLCVTYTQTAFIYTNGAEPGFIVGLINYPRFPLSAVQIKAHAIAIAGMLLRECKQLKVTVVMPSETVMISAPENAWP